MNQIVYSGEQKNKVEINKPIVVFAIIIIIFAIVLIGQGAFFLIKGNGKDKIKNSNTKSPDIITNAEGSTVEVKIKHEIAMNNIYYSWKNGEENEMNNVKGNKEVTENLFLPNEDTTLNIRVVDQNNEEFKFTKEFKYSEGADIVKPKIKLTSVPGNVVVTITDNKEISYIEYNWNNEEAVRVQAGAEEKTKMEYKIVAKEGKNKLTVVAVDASGNAKSEEKEIVTVTKPTIDLKKNKGEIIIKVSDEEEVTKVEYEINGTVYTKENTGENKKEFEIRDLLAKGTNIIKVTAYNKAGLSSEKTGKCTY